MSEPNVRRYLRTHRICYPPDYRQLAERGLSPRKIRSFVGCSLLFQAFPNATAGVLASQANHQILDLWTGARSSRRAALFGPVELFRDQFAIPGKKGIGFGD